MVGYLMMCTTNDKSSGTRKHEKANMQYDRKSLKKEEIKVCRVLEEREHSTSRE